MPYTGSPRAVCDICGLEYHLRDLRKNWKGQMVCRQDYEERHPQDFVRARREPPPPRDLRPDPGIVFVSGLECELSGRTAVPNDAVPDCAIPDWTPSI